MDWYPLYNSLRIAAVSCVLVLFVGIFAAYYVAKLPRAVKGVLDVFFTLPMVLPPTVCGYFLLVIFGKGPGLFCARPGPDQKRPGLKLPFQVFNSWLIKISSHIIKSTSMAWTIPSFI